MIRHVELDDPHHFRLTLWPGIPLPLPLFERRSTYQLNDSATALIAPADAVPVTERHGQTYLKLDGLNLDDPRKILGFARKYGTVTGGVYTLLQYHPHFADQWDAEADRAERDAVSEHDTEAERVRASFPWLDDVTTLASFRFGARCIKDFYLAWQLIRNPRLRRDTKRWAVRPDLGVPTQADALDLLTGPFLKLVPPFRPLLQIPANPDPPEPSEIDDLANAEWIEGARGVDLDQAQSFTPWATLSQICALEIYNHIAGGEIPRKCQNETCQNEFTVQYGRAEHGMSKRHGVLYCSSSCAQAQAQRMYRRRQKALRQTSSDGLHDAVEPPA
jgi:hypothetical protein